MSTAGEINEAEGYVVAAYRAVAEKGGGLPPQKNLANLKLAVDDIPLGDGTEWGTLYTTAYPSGLVLDGENSYKTLGTGTSASSMITVNGVSIGKDSIIGFSFGRSCTYAPSSFLMRCVRLASLEHTEVLTEIGNQFLRECNDFNAKLNLKNVTKIGYRFLDYCYKYSQPISLSAKLESVGYGFMCNMRSFVGPVQIETDATPPDRANLYYSLAGATSGTDSYREGITITGSKAPIWKEALPDVASSSSGYRKLILVEE